MAQPSFPPHPERERAPRRGLSTGAKIGIGCGALALLAIIALVLIGTFGTKYLMKVADQQAQPYVERGYNKVVGGEINVGQAVSGPTVYIGGRVTINAPQTQDIAVIAGECWVNADIDATLDFTGGELHVAEGVSIRKKTERHDISAPAPPAPAPAPALEPAPAQ